MPVTTKTFIFLQLTIGKNIKKCENKESFFNQFVTTGIIWRFGTRSNEVEVRKIWGCCIKIPLGKQWNCRSPWSPNWLPAGTDGWCWSVNECGCYGKIIAWQSNHIRAVRWVLCRNYLNHQEWRNSRNAEKHLFLHILVANDDEELLPGCRSSYFWFMPDQQHEPKRCVNCWNNPQICTL